MQKAPSKEASSPEKCLQNVYKAKVGNTKLTCLCFIAFVCVNHVACSIEFIHFEIVWLHLQYVQKVKCQNSISISLCSMPHNRNRTFDGYFILTFSIMATQAQHISCQRLFAFFPFLLLFGILCLVQGQLISENLI